MNKKHWTFLIGYLVGSFFGINRIFGMLKVGG